MRTLADKLFGFQFFLMNLASIYIKKSPDDLRFLYGFQILILIFSQIRISKTPDNLGVFDKYEFANINSSQ